MSCTMRGHNVHVVWNARERTELRAALSYDDYAKGDVIVVVGQFQDIRGLVIGEVIPHENSDIYDENRSTCPKGVYFRWWDELNQRARR